MELGEHLKPIIEKVQVNIPFGMFFDGYLELFESAGLNPEIGMDAEAWNPSQTLISKRLPRFSSVPGAGLPFMVPLRTWRQAPRTRGFCN